MAISNEQRVRLVDQKTRLNSALAEQKCDPVHWGYKVDQNINILLKGERTPRISSSRELDLASEELERQLAHRRVGRTPPDILLLY